MEYIFTKVEVGFLLDALDEQLDILTAVEGRTEDIVEKAYLNTRITILEDIADVLRGTNYDA